MKKKIIAISVVILLILFIIGATTKKKCSVISDDYARDRTVVLIDRGYCKGNYELVLTTREPTKLILDEIEYLEALKEHSADYDETVAHTKGIISSEEYLLTSEPTVVKVDLKEKVIYDIRFPEKQQDEKLSVSLHYKMSKIPK